MEEQTLTPFDSIELMNCFNQLYNAKHDKSGSMIEGTNIKDPTSTNDKMELFYEYMGNHQDLMYKKRELIDIYDANDKLNSDEYNVYALAVEKDIKFLSHSYISLLYYGYKELRTKKEWNIIEL